MGVLAGRYVDERFPLDNEAVAIFQRSVDGRKTLYYVTLEEKPADV